MPVLLLLLLLLGFVSFDQEGNITILLFEVAIHLVCVPVDAGSRMRGQITHRSVDSTPDTVWPISRHLPD